MLVGPQLRRRWLDRDLQEDGYVLLLGGKSPFEDHALSVDKMKSMRLQDGFVQDMFNCISLTFQHERHREIEEECRQTSSIPEGKNNVL